MFERFPFCLWCLSIPQVPSAFFVADCFLQLHRYYLNGKLFRPDRAQRETVLALAGDEGSKAKRCIGALRYLWRNAKGSSHDRHVQELKDFLISSPIQEANARARAEESEAENEDAGEPAPADDPQDEASSNEDAGEPAPADDPQDEASSNEDAGEPAPADDPQDEALSSSSEVEQADNDMEIDNGGSQGDSVDASSLYAQTLLLGGESVSSEGNGSDHAVAEDENEEFVCSQVRPEGWLGGFYTKWKTAYGLKESDLKAMDDVPPKNPHLFVCKAEMNSEVVAHVMDGV